MSPFPTVLLTGFVALAALAVHRLFIRPYFSPLRTLPCPPGGGLLQGHLGAIFKADTGVLHEKWVEQYGTTLRYKGILNSDRFMTLDLKALNHIINRTDIYQKDPQTSQFLGKMLGFGLLVAEGEQHKHQRRTMNPAFGPAQIRELSGIFLSKAYELRDTWVTKASESADGIAHVDALSSFSKATLDIIGLAGFDYSFNSLSRPSDQPDELSRAFTTIFTSGNFSILPFLASYFPPLRLIATERQRKMAEASSSLKSISQGLLTDKKAVAMSPDKAKAKDLLSLLVRSNISDAGGLSDGEVLAQIPTFLLAGHETTSTALTWCIYALSLNPAVQSRLRDELAGVELSGPETAPMPLDQQTLAALNALPYLDAVVKETLRLYAPVPNTVRAAVKDDVIPLGEPYIGLDGKEHNEIHVKAGQPVFIPILLVNRSKALWGEDAAEFIPERHLPPHGPPEATNSVPGVFAHILTFLGGPHACIGYRFTILEMKIILAILLKEFSFELAVPADKVGRRTAITTRPVLLDEVEKGGQLPILVKPVLHE